MDVLRTLGILAVVALLTITLASASLVAGAHQTVLDPEFAKQTLAEEDAYRVLSPAAMAPGAGGASGGETDGSETAGTESGEAAASAESGGIAAGAGPELVSALFTPAYVRGQAEANVDRAYGYLHGRRDELALYVDLRPVKRNSSDVVAERIRNRSVAELLRLGGGSGASVGATGSDAAGGENASADASAPGPVDASLLATLASDREGYREARRTFRADVRERVLDRMTAVAFGNASNDERLALVVPDYDPGEHTDAEKRRMVDERESEIRAAMRVEIERNRSDEVDRGVEAAIDEVARAATESSGGAEFETGDGAGDDAGGNVSAAASDLRDALLLGLTADDPDYRTFRGDVRAAKDRVASAVGELAAAQLDAEMPDRMSLTDEMGPDVRRQAATARTAVRAVDALVVALPILSLLLVATLFRLARTGSRAAALAGVSALFAAGVTGLPIAYARPMLPELLPGGVAGEVVSGVALRVFDVLSTQAIALAGLGAAFLVATAILRLRGARAADPSE